MKRVWKPPDFGEYTHGINLSFPPEQRNSELLSSQQFVFWGGGSLTRDVSQEWAVNKIAEGCMKSLVKRVHRH